MGRLTPAWTEWAVVQTEVVLEGFMGFGVLALIGALLDGATTQWPMGFDPMVSMALHILAAASVAAAIDAARHPGFVTRFAMVLLGVAWLAAAVFACLTAYQPVLPSDPTRVLPVVIILGLAAYGFAWRRHLK